MKIGKNKAEEKWMRNITSFYGYKMANEIISDMHKRNAKRKELLGLEPLESVVWRRYEFNFPASIDLKEEDETKVKEILNEIAKKRYASKEIPFAIYDTDREIRNFECGKWSTLELRWPGHWADYIDTMTLTRDPGFLAVRGEPRNPLELRIWFVRGKREVSSSKKRQILDEDAARAYQEIYTRLVKD